MDCPGGRRSYNLTGAVATPAGRNVAILGASLFVLAVGEELWQAYMPAYLTALGAGSVAVGLFGSLRDLLDSAYQFPGGQLTERLGHRRTLLILTAVAAGGYAIYALAPSWIVVMVGLLGVMAWKAGAFPMTFAVIGASLPPGRRAGAFAVQSVLVRVPRVISAPLGGIVIASLGTVGAIRLLCAVSVVLALGMLVVQRRYFTEPMGPVVRPRGASFRAVFRSMPIGLRYLLVADSIVRIGEGIAASFIVLFVTQVSGATLAQFGVLYAIQQAVAMACYLPGGKIADASGRRGIIATTFLCFAAFPISIRIASGYAGLIAAFVIGGLKEIGEPARKSLIVDLAPDDQRATTVGVYYAIRNGLVVPSGLLGGLLWQQAPHLPLEVAAVVSLAGLIGLMLTPAPPDFGDREPGSAARNQPPDDPKIEQGR